MDEKPPLDEVYLEHFGVKGMKWGVRRAELNKDNPSYTKRMRSNDAESYGKGGVKRINRNINKGKTRKKAIEKEERRETLKIAALLGATVAARFLVVAGPLAAQGVRNRAETNRGRNAIPAIMAAAPMIRAKSRRGVHNITTM